MGDVGQGARQQEAVRRTQARDIVVARPGIEAESGGGDGVSVALVGTTQHEGRGVVAQGHVVERGGRDRRRDVEQVVHVAQVGQALVVEDRVELHRERGPQRRRGAGAAAAVIGAHHVVVGLDVVGVAAGVGGDIGCAAAGLGQRVGRDRAEAVFELIGGS